jgi:hypothetical protein
MAFSTPLFWGVLLLCSHAHAFSGTALCDHYTHTGMGDVSRHEPFNSTWTISFDAVGSNVSVTMDGKSLGKGPMPGKWTDSFFSGNVDAGLYYSLSLVSVFANIDRCGTGLQLPTAIAGQVSFESHSTTTAGTCTFAMSNQEPWCGMGKDTCSASAGCQWCDDHVGAGSACYSVKETKCLNTSRFFCQKL